MAANTIRTQQTLFASLRPAGQQRQSMTPVGEVNWGLLAGRHCGGIERTRRPMQRTGQTREARLLRLSEGRCPVHGQPMTLVSEANGLRVVQCPQVRCDVRGVQMPTGSRAVRLPAAHQHLLSVA
jgi:hypothetical protein